MKGALTTGQIAAYCDTTPMTVISWITKGWLRGHQLPGRGDRRVKVGHFLAFLRENNLPIPEEFESSSLRVLIVEDESLIAISIETALQKAGFETRIAPDGFRAGSLLESFKPNVMTLDLNMRGVNGLEVLQYVKERELHHEVKILVISAMPQEELDAALEIGADEAIGKPIIQDDIVKRVSRLAGVELIRGKRSRAGQPIRQRR